VRKGFADRLRLLNMIEGETNRMIKMRITIHFVAVLLAILVFGLKQNVAHAQAPDFTIASTALSPAPVNTGTPATATVTISPINGFNQPVALSVPCPTGASCTFNPATVTPSGAAVNSTLTIIPNTSTPASNALVISGTSGALSHSTPTALNVQLAATTDTLKNDLGFGIALGLTTNVTGPNIVTNATIDANGIVRVNTRANTTAGLMLETHYYIWPRPPADGEDDTRRWGTGPFVAAQPGSSQIISAVGAGWMFGFRRAKGTRPSGFGLGVGYEAIPAAQVLGSEFVDGKPAPLGPNGSPLPIRFETQDKGSLMVILSVSF
jgi:hypothetical protein